jgi:amino acid transporter
VNKLIRGLSLPQAIAINTIDMVGIGPFVTLSFIMGAMQGPACILAWLLGAMLAFADGCVWAELGAKWPEAGGSYMFLRKLFDGLGVGRLFAFLYTWQTMIQGPLVIASGAIGFALYFSYLVPLAVWQQKAVSGTLVIFITMLLYRKINDIGKISLFFGGVVIITLLWLIVSGLSSFHTLNFSVSNMGFDGSFVHRLGTASAKAIYCYLGYYNVCHLGGEIKNPERNIPRSIFASVAIIGALYLLMQLSVLAVVPWQQAKDSPFVISLFFEKLYGPLAAQVATGLVLMVALSSLFAVMLGYSRVPYAAAADGNFFPVFARLHPTKNFPHVSLLVIAGLAFVFSLLFKMQQLITAIIVMRILVQFVSQAVGLLLYHRQHKSGPFPFRMCLYPLPPVLAILTWLFIFFSADVKFMAGALLLIATGVVLFYAGARYIRRDAAAE